MPHLLIGMSLLKTFVDSSDDIYNANDYSYAARKIQDIT